MESNANMEAYIYALENVDLDALDAIAQQMADTLDGRGRIFVAGNGGSHAIAQHFASDLMKPVGKDELCCHVECLSNNVALITAISNDIDYGNIFSMQIKAAKLEEKDFVLAFSVSGMSVNIQEMFRESYRRLVKGCLITGVDYIGSNPGTVIPVWFCRNPVTVSPNSPLYYYVCESVFSAISHEIARLFHIKRGNYSA